MEPNHYYYVRSGDFHILLRIRVCYIGTRTTLKPENWLVHPVTVRFDYVFSTKSLEDLNRVLRHAAAVETQGGSQLSVEEFRRKVKQLKELREEVLLTQQEFEEKVRMLSKDL